MNPIFNSIDYKPTTDSKSKYSLDIKSDQDTTNDIK